MDSKREEEVNACARDGSVKVGTIIACLIGEQNKDGDQMRDKKKAGLARTEWNIKDGCDGGKQKHLNKRRGTREGTERAREVLEERTEAEWWKQRAEDPKTNRLKADIEWKEWRIKAALVNSTYSKLTPVAIRSFLLFLQYLVKDLSCHYIAS